jgi:hypothetical protein
MLLHRDEDGTFTASSPDGEYGRRGITKDEARQMLQDRGCPPDTLAKIMSETRPGFVMT